VEPGTKDTFKVEPGTKDTFKAEPGTILSRHTTQLECEGFSPSRELWLEHKDTFKVELEPHGFSPILFADDLALLASTEDDL
jgi:hypothetical protein